MLDSFSQGDTRGCHVNIYHCGNISFGHGSNKREATGACNDSLTHFFVATIHRKFIGFDAIKFLQSENIFVLTEALRYHKQLSTSLIAVGDIIIGKSFDKLVKARDDDVLDHRPNGTAAS